MWYAVYESWNECDIWILEWMWYMNPGINVIYESWNVIWMQFIQIALGVELFAWRFRSIRLTPQLGIVSIFLSEETRISNQSSVDCFHIFKKVQLISLDLFLSLSSLFPQRYLLWWHQFGKVPVVKKDFFSCCWLRRRYMWNNWFDTTKHWHYATFSGTYNCKWKINNMTDWVCEKWTKIFQQDLFWIIIIHCLSTIFWNATRTFPENCKKCGNNFFEFHSSKRFEVCARILVSLKRDLVFYKHLSRLNLLLHCLSEFVSSARPLQISGQVLSSPSTMSTSRTVRQCCTPWRGRWTGQWRTL